MGDLCGNHLPGARAEIQPCPRSAGHDGEHVYFAQTARPEQTTVHNGVWVYGEDGKVRQHITFEGYVDPADIGLLVEYFDYIEKVSATEHA